MKKGLLKYLLILFILALTGCNKEAVKEDKFAVSFSTNIDIEFNSLELTKGQILKEIDLPSKKVTSKIFIGWFLDVNYEIEFIEFEIIEDITLYGMYEEYSSRDEYFALEGINIPVSTYQNITLNSKVSGFDIVWTTSNEEVLSSSGAITNVDINTEVVLTAIINTNDIVFTKEYTVMVNPFPYASKAEEIAETIKFPVLIEKDLVLNRSFSFEFVGKWLSSDTSVIGNDGKVTRSDRDKNVTLTLTLNKDNYTRVFTFEVIVKECEIDVNDPRYFINALVDKDIDVNEAIMSNSEIIAFNNVVANSSGANVVKLEELDTQVTKGYVNSLILKYSNIDSYGVYNNGVRISSIDKQAILANRDLDAISNTVDIKYAVSVKHTNLRTYPTDFYSNNNTMDRFQETGFSAGVPMVVYHTSKDGNWYYVRMFHYDGWVKATDIALASRDDFLKYNKTGDFIVVLSNLLEIENQTIRMGYTLPYSSKTESMFTVNFPTRKNDGTLETKDVLISNDDKVNDGYISYTYTNLLSQAYKLLGMQYSWGDKLVNGLDCSSTQAAIYNCFGFVFGRNTSNQRKTDNYGKPVSSLTNEKLKAYQVGTLLYTSGHVLMFVGVDKDGNCWLLHNTSTGYICKLQTLNSYGSGAINNMLLLHN